MKNAFLRIGYTCASILMAGALASAATVNIASVTLPNAVSVGSATLPGGHYTIASEGDGTFLIQSDNGQKSAMLMGRRIESGEAARRTEVVLSGEGDSLHLNKLFIEGQTEGYEFQR